MKKCQKTAIFYIFIKNQEFFLQKNICGIWFKAFFCDILITKVENLICQNGTDYLLLRY